MSDPYSDLLNSIGGCAAGFVGGRQYQQQTALQNHIYQMQMMQNAYGVYDVLLGIPSTRLCAYCGTKQKPESRCESCGAPER